MISKTVCYKIVYVLIFTYSNISFANNEFQFKEKYVNIVKEYAPVMLQSVDRHPKYDYIQKIDFDGDLDTSNNVDNIDKVSEKHIAIYGTVVAETSDSYYLFYGFYHVRDYDSRYREFLFAAAAHDNDFEGCMVLISKSEKKPIALEFWSHNRFYQYSIDYNKEKVNLGKEEIDGKLFLENNKNPLLYIPDKGHGGRTLRQNDLSKIDSKRGFLYRPIWHKTQEERNINTSVRYYKIESMNLFYEHAKLEDSKLLAYQTHIAGDLYLNAFIAGEYKGGDNWARPKVPWAWFQTFMSSGSRIGLWYFHPAYVFKLNFGLNVDQKYIYNEPLLVFLGKIDDDFLTKLTSSKIKQSKMSRNIRSLWDILIDHIKNTVRKIIDFLFGFFG